MKFTFLVYYFTKEEMESLSWNAGDSFKKINAKSEKDAMEKFKIKYPGLIPRFAIK